MRIVILGGTGHVGSFLVPRLVDLAHEVISISRQEREPYVPHSAWTSVQTIKLDRDAAEKAGTFGQQIREMAPDVVIDMICFTPESAMHLVEALRDSVRQFLHCGTIWVHGHSTRVPTSEAEPRRPFGDYGINKAAIERNLLAETQRTGFPATVLHPGQLSLPNLGMETVHHVHADDVAQAFVKALDNWNNAVGESFHVVSPGALTLRGYAEAMAAWFGQEARLTFTPWEKWKNTVSDQEAEMTLDHIGHSPNCSIAKARRSLDYQPRYTSLQAVQESVNWLIENDGLP